MGGGGDSRIPSILNGALRRKGVRVVVRTYDFDPEISAEQIAGWVEELRPSLIIGESLGAVHAIRIKGIPHILISPALNAPVYFSFLAWFSLLPGVTYYFSEKYRPVKGDRQKLRFTFSVLRKFRRHRKIAMANSTLRGSGDYFHAFIGKKDHYRKNGIVSIRTWKKYFGDTYSTYNGSHFTEERFVRRMVIPKILKVLDINR